MLQWLFLGIVGVALLLGPLLIFFFVTKAVGTIDKEEEQKQEKK